MLDRKSCSTSDPCSKYGDKISGCMSSLKPVDISGHKLAPEAADALNKLLKDMPDDVRKAVRLTDTYRTAKVQCNIFDFDHFEKTGKRRKIGTAGTPVAQPGTSNHGWGRAIDIFPDKVQKWIKENGSKYGWCWGEAKSEPWHFTFCGPGANKSKVCGSICKGSIDPSLSKPSSDSGKTEEPSTPSTLSTDEPKPSGGGSLTDFFRSMYQNLKSAGLGQTQLKEIHEDVDRITDIMKKIL